MIPSPRPSRTSPSLSESLQQQLNMYALATTAAGVSLLALAQPAEGKIVYTPAHRVIPPHNTYNIDLNHDGITDFTIGNSVSACTDYCFFELRQFPANGNQAVGYFLGSGSFLADLALTPGATIGPRSPFKKGTAAMAVARANQYSSHKTNLFGQWPNVRDRYLGLGFRIKGEIHFGWARLNVAVRGTTITAVLTGYAYETIPNKPIIAGETKGTDVEESNASVNPPTPAPATLGLLALGSPALSIWRREESAGAAH